MANTTTAFMNVYRPEYIAAFEVGYSMLKACCVNESVIQGQTAYFMTAGTNGATAVTRGTNGLIPPRSDDLNQYAATLVEWHDKPRRTKFNIFASQGDGRRILQEGSVKVMNRKIDSDILAELANTTTTWNSGTAVTASLAMVAGVQAKLAKNAVEVEDEDNMFFVGSPAMRAYLMQTKEFANAQYVDVKPMIGPARKMLRWMGFNWMFYPLVSGVGTAAEICYAFHRNSIGHAVNVGDMEAVAGYNEEDSYYWARASMFMGSKLLQTNGAVKITHDGSAYA